MRKLTCEETRSVCRKGYWRSLGAARVNGHPESRLPNTVNIGFEFVEEVIPMRDGRKGNLRFVRISVHVRFSGTFPRAESDGCTRTAISRLIWLLPIQYNTQDEIQYVIQELPGIIEFLRSMSPFFSAANTQNTPLFARCHQVGNGDENWVAGQTAFL